MLGVFCLLHTALCLGLLAQTTAFTYQGQLTVNGLPANGIHDLRFTIHDWDTGDSVVAGPLTNASVAVSNGLFTVSLDFGAGVFDGGDRWLEIGVRSNGIGAFSTLTPRQALLPGPYALYTAQAGTAANVSPGAITTAALQDGAVTSAKILDGTVVNADLAPTAGIVDTKLANITSAGKVANSATTATSTNVARAIVARDNSGNFAAGVITATAFSGNGAALTALNAGQLTSGTVPNARLSATVSQLGQTVESSEITDGTIQAADVDPASFNTTFWRTDGNAGTVAGTHFLGTTENQPLEIKVGGMRAVRIENNVDGGDPGLVPDGAPNFIAGSPGNFVAVGVVGATISGGGSTNYDGFTRTNAVLADYGAVGGGLANRVESGAVAGVIGGGFANDVGVNAAYGTVGGGYNNNLASGADYATIGGGIFNDIGTNADHSAILGGYDNNILAAGLASAIVGGTSNRIGANLRGAFIGGGTQNTIADHSTNAIIGGGRLNAIGAQSLYTTISGGSGNTIGDSTYYATLAGGVGNEILENATASTIGGGGGNTIQYDTTYATISGGANNTIWNDATHATISGGAGNAILSGATHATIAGGHQNLISSSYAFAAGRRAKALHPGAFVWADSTSADFSSTTNDQFNIRASGGVRLSDTTPGISFGTTQRQMLNLASTNFGIGVQSLTTYFRSDSRFAWYRGGSHAASGPGGGGLTLMSLDVTGLFVNGVFVSLSDRHQKENFTPVDSQEILEKVAALPLARWNFKGGDTTAHLGPMAQDFHAAFGLGANDTTIATVDADGVALAAIQGLNAKVESGKTELAELRAENAALKARLEKLEQLLESQLGGGAK